jgi:GT2 family glycosyltransferase
MLNAAELLKSNSPEGPAWARFDAEWYLRRYEAARLVCGVDTGAALDYYLETGAGLQHAPSPLFDERFYLSSNPDVAELVRVGKYWSGFDHFCRFGHRVLSPHWLFDDRLYGRIYDDMSLENLDHHKCFGRYDHYLKSGQFEGRTAQYLFDAAFYREEAIAAGVAAEDVDAAGAYTHYLYRLHSGLPELQPSIYFEPKWYLQNNIGARRDVETGFFSSAIEHYLCNETPELFDPVPEFSEAHYRKAYGDIKHAVENGYFRNGYQHFLTFGAVELREPNPHIDLVYYRDKNDCVRDDLNTGAVRDAFAHLRLIGVPRRLAFVSPDRMPAIDEAAAKQLFVMKTRSNLALFGRARLDFTLTGPAAVSVIVVLFNRFELTMLSLASLRDNYAGEIELIIVDNASTDDTRRIGQYVTGAILLRQDENLGFLRAANLGLDRAGAAAVLFMNNDVELGHGAVVAALRRLNSTPDIGAVGGKIVRSHGRLQEAGSIIWRDGTTDGYMRDASPLAAEANFVRNVDYCSAVFLMCRGALLTALGGFDEAFSPAYYEDADLCVRMAAQKFRTVYDPAILVHHVEFGSASNSEAAAMQMRRAHKVFVARHQAFLRGKQEKRAENVTRARSVGPTARRVLFFEDTVPLRRLGSGFVRANDAVHAIAAAGFDVTVFPVNGAPHDVMSIFGDMPEGVEAMHDRDINGLAKFLAERRGFYDLVWVSRTHNLGRLLPIFAEAGFLRDDIPIILDTEAVATVRDALRAAAGAENFNFDAALREEFVHAGICQHILAVNRPEVDLLHSIELPAVSLLGTCREPAPGDTAFEAREGLLFVAGIHQMDSPNLDSLNWYVDEILPALRAEFDEVPILHFAGYTGPEIDLSAFRSNPFVKLHGPVYDLRRLYDASRVFVAPSRFAAGTPYKIYEAASFGLPCVVTDLLAGQLGWLPGRELLAAPVNDARRFAAQIAVLYRTEAVWRKLREQALLRLAAENSRTGFNQAVGDVLSEVLSARHFPLRSTAQKTRRPAGKSVPVG